MTDIKLCKTLKFLSSTLDKISNNALKEKDLSITQGLVLLWLNEEPTQELPIKVIEKKFGTAQSTTYGVINRLEQKSLVHTYLSEHRTKFVKLTQEGLQLVDFIASTMMQTDSLMFAHFSEGEQLLFLELLKKAETTMLQYHGIKMEDYYE